MSCPIKVNSNTIELTVHSSCYCVLDLLCVMVYFVLLISKKDNLIGLQSNYKFCPSRFIMEGHSAIFGPPLYWP